MLFIVLARILLGVWDCHHCAWLANSLHLLQNSLLFLLGLKGNFQGLQCELSLLAD